MPASSQSTTKTRPKRLDSEGTVYQIKRGPRAGEWRAQLSVPGGTRRTFSGRSEEVVAQKLLDARFRLSHGLLGPTSGETFEEYARAWLAARRHELRYNTRRSYARNLEMHVFPIFGASLKLTDVKTADLRRVHLALLDSGHKPKTVQLVHSIVSAVLAQAESDELVPSNVAKKVRLPKRKKPNFLPLQPEEIQTLLQAMRGDPLEALFLVTLACGLRRGEACGIRWSDLDLGGATLRLAGQIVREPKSRFVFSPLKSDTGETLVIPLAPPVVEALLAHKDRQSFLRANAAELWSEQDYVFTNAIGGPIDPMQAYRMFKALLVRAGVRDQRFHDLRHASASLLLSWGLELWQVGKLLRHSGLSITSDIYGHLYQQSSREIADRMGAFIQEAR